VKNEKRRPEGRRSQDQLPGQIKPQNTAPVAGVQGTICPVACVGVRCVFACPVVTQ